MTPDEITLLQRRKRDFDDFYRALIPTLVEFVGLMGIEPSHEVLKNAVHVASYLDKSLKDRASGLGWTMSLGGVPGGQASSVDWATGATGPTFDSVGKSNLSQVSNDTATGQYKNVPSHPLLDALKNNH